MRIHLLFSLVLRGGIAAFGAPAFNHAESELIRIERTRLDALVAADVPALQRMMADDLVYVHASGRVQGKQEYLGLLATGDLQYVSVKYDEPPRVRVYHGGTAIVTGRLRVEARTKTGTPNQRMVFSTAVYVKADGEWRLVSQHGTAVPQP